MAEQTQENDPAAANRAGIGTKKARWTKRACDRLAELLEDHIGVIRDKSGTPGASEREKAAWREIHDRFNADASLGYKTVDQLYKKKENMVTMTKSAIDNGTAVAKCQEGANWISKIAALFDISNRPMDNLLDCDSQPEINENSEREEGTDETEIIVGNILDSDIIVSTNGGEAIADANLAVTPRSNRRRYERNDTALLKLRKIEHDKQMELMEIKKQRLEIEIKKLEQEIQWWPRKYELECKKLELDIRKIELELRSRSRLDVNN